MVDAIIYLVFFFLITNQINIYKRLELLLSEGDDSISVTSYAIEKVQVPKLISKQTNYYLMTDFK